jgi:hypothetical protein
MRVFEGTESIRAALEGWYETYEEYEQIVEESRALGDGVTLGIALVRGRAKGSSAVVERRLAIVATWRGGVMERVWLHADIDEARSAAERLARERG